MFLNSLSKKQKNLFMDLAIKAAEANGVVELAEKNMLKAYGMEMEISPFYSSDCETEMVLQEIKDVSTESELKIVLFEILGILISDEDFDDSEKEFLNRVRTSFDISQEKCDEMLKLLYDYSSVYQKIVAAVL